MGPTWPNRFTSTRARRWASGPTTKMDTDSHPNDPGEDAHHLARAPLQVRERGQLRWTWPGIRGGFGIFQLDADALGLQTRRPPTTTAARLPTRRASRRPERGTLPSVSIIDPAFIFAPCDTTRPRHQGRSGVHLVDLKAAHEGPERWEKTSSSSRTTSMAASTTVKPPTVAEENARSSSSSASALPALVIGASREEEPCLARAVRPRPSEHGHAPLRARPAEPSSRRANDVSDCIDRNSVETPYLALSDRASQREPGTGASSTSRSARASVRGLANVVLGGRPPLEGEAPSDGPDARRVRSHRRGEHPLVGRLPVRRVVYSSVCTAAGYVSIMR